MGAILVGPQDALASERIGIRLGFKSSGPKELVRRLAPPPPSNPGGFRV